MIYRIVTEGPALKQWLTQSSAPVGPHTPSSQNSRVISLARTVQPLSKETLMYRTKTNSYYSLLFASFVAVVGCGSEDGDTDVPVEETMEPDTAVDAGSPDAASLDAGTGGKVDAAVDAMVSRPDAMTAPVDGSAGGSDAGTSDAMVGPRPGNFEHGETLAADNNCASCHRPNFAGAGLYPNITPDVATGVGSWTDKQIGDAITKGIGKDGTPLCAVMARFELSEGEVADLVAYIRGIPAVSKSNAGGCD